MKNLQLQLLIFSPQLPATHFRPGSLQGDEKHFPSSYFIYFNFKYELQSLR